MNLPLSSCDLGLLNAIVTVASADGSTGADEGRWVEFPVTPGLRTYTVDGVVSVVFVASSSLNY